MAPPSSYPTRSASIAEISATDSMFSTAFHPPVHWTSSSLLKLRVLPVIIRIADWQQMNKDTRRLITSKRVQSFACAQNFCLRHRSLKAELALATNLVHQKVESCKFHFYPWFARYFFQLLKVVCSIKPRDHLVCRYILLKHFALMNEENRREDPSDCSHEIIRGNKTGSQ